MSNSSQITELGGQLGFDEMKEKVLPKAAEVDILVDEGDRDWRKDFSFEKSLNSTFGMLFPANFCGGQRLFPGNRFKIVSLFFITQHVSSINQSLIFEPFHNSFQIRPKSRTC